MNCLLKVLLTEKRLHFGQEMALEKACSNNRTNLFIEFQTIVKMLPQEKGARVLQFVAITFDIGEVPNKIHSVLLSLRCRKFHASHCFTSLIQSSNLLNAVLSLGFMGK